MPILYYLEMINSKIYMNNFTNGAPYNTPYAYLPIKIKVHYFGIRVNSLITSCVINLLTIVIGMLTA